MWDFLITVGSLAVGAWFVVLEPLLRKWRERGGETEAPRFPPPTISRKNNNDRFNDLLAEIVAMGEVDGAAPPVVPVGTTGTTGTGNVPVPGTSTDTQQENSQYHMVKDMILQGFSGNQIFKKLGGKRQAVLDLVRLIKKDLGIEVEKK